MWHEGFLGGRNKDFRAGWICTENPSTYIILWNPASLSAADPRIDAVRERQIFATSLRLLYLVPALMQFGSFVDAWVACW